MRASPQVVVQRQRLSVQGVVQGVGFRPFIFGLATDLGLGGFVRNDSHGVLIEVEGPLDALDLFRTSLHHRPPPLARIDSVSAVDIAPAHDIAFVIAHSQSSNERNTLISPDVATCADCLSELLDPNDRRFGYPFTNCTNCGPRFTIVQDIPYDRHNTTMRTFPLCPPCQAEYADPRNRRFHTQPNACPTCGPHVRLLDGQGHVLETSDPIADAAQRLAAGEILTIKGLGGYHLVCDALDELAVKRLRQRKHREAKPFALMALDLDTVRRFCVVSSGEAELLQSHRRPIVLLQQRAFCPLAPEVAPRYNTVGVMLPYTPLHTLLLTAFAQTIGADCPAVLVMTSGNLSDEPIAYRDEDAQTRLLPLADGALIHNRPIHTRCDDSVTRMVAGGEQIVRRARGYVPEPIRLAHPCPASILACGGHLKNTFCLGKEHQAFVSHHIGDMENLETLCAFRASIHHFQQLFDIQPEVVAHDLHPDYLATKHALELDVPCKIGVQHHHAHIASVLAEHNLSEPVIGVAADGSGYGTDGALWGCEIMIADMQRFERLAHLAYVPLPGGAQAIRQPWRMAAAYLNQTYGSDFLALDISFVQRLDRKRWLPLAQMIERGINSPPTSSLGRLFDAVAALLGVRNAVSYEGQAAIELEMLAAPAETVYPFELVNKDNDVTPAQLDIKPLMRAMVDDILRGVPTPRIAGRFHRAVAEMLVASCRQVRRQTGLERVALSGGVFQNRLLLEQMWQLLKREGFTVYINRQVPPNDGGLSLGQIAIAAAQMRAGS